MATEQQIPKLAGQIVEHQSSFAALSNDDAQFVITETRKAIELFVEAVENRVPETENKLLQFVTSVAVSTTQRFVAADHFKHGEVVDGVKLYLGDNFRTHFFTKVEENVQGGDIRVHKLLRASRDLNIRAEIGEEREETQLAHLWGLLKLQASGEEGALLTNGYANIFYIRDNKDVLWSVNARWYSDDREWGLGADSVARPDEWHADSFVCSR